MLLFDCFAWVCPNQRQVLWYFRGMADGEVADPAQELTLRAQVEEASGADLAAALPSAHYFKWLMFKKALPPQLVSTDKGVYLAPPSAAATQAQSYAYYFEPLYEKGAGQFKLKCRAGACGTECSYAVRAFKDDAVTYTYPFANAFKHLLVCAGRPMLLLADSDKLEGGVKKRKQELLGGAGGGGGGGGAGPDDLIEAHLQHLQLTKTLVTEALVVASVCDAQPLSQYARFGTRFAFRVLRLPCSRTRGGTGTR